MSTSTSSVEPTHSTSGLPTKISGHRLVVQIFLRSCENVSIFVFWTLPSQVHKKSKLKTYLFVEKAKKHNSLVTWSRCEKTLPLVRWRLGPLLPLPRPGNFCISCQRSSSPLFRQHWIFRNFPGRKCHIHPLRPKFSQTLCGKSASIPSFNKASQN